MVQLSNQIPKPFVINYRFSCRKRRFREDEIGVLVLLLRARRFAAANKIAHGRKEAPKLPQD